MVATIDEILDEWSRDSKVDETSVSPELLKISKLHSKYLRFMAENSLLAKKRIVDYQKMKAIKWDYYNGKMSKEELDERGWKQYLHTVQTKDGIERCLDKDEDLINILLLKAMNDDAVTVTTGILKELNARTYQLKSWVDYQKYLLGH
jgi:hypothetical protein